jgi:hypothetical protein
MLNLDFKEFIQSLNANAVRYLVIYRIWQISKPCPMTKFTLAAGLPDTRLRSHPLSDAIRSRL